MQILTSQTSTNRLTFIEAASQMEKQFDVKFSFNTKSAKRFMVSKPLKNKSLSEILTNYTTQDSITFTAIGKRYISVQFPVKQVDFCVTLINTQTGVPIKNAIIRSLYTIYTTDKGGTLRINEISEEETLQIYVDDQFVRELTIFEFFDPLKKCPLLYINKYINQLPTVTLKSYITPGIEKTTQGAIKIKSSDFEILPSLVEPDVLQIAQVLPGIESYDETASNINIRGGASDETTILWNDIRMYQTGHFFGLISAFNPNLIENVLIYKNGTHPRYSEGVSGVVHMYPSSKISQEIEGGIGLNLSSIHAFFKIPVSETFAIHASGRTSINTETGNPIYKSFFERTFQNTEVTSLNNNTTQGVRRTDENFNFYDFSISALWDISLKDTLRYHFMTINNKLQFNERFFNNNISTVTFNELKQRTLLGGFTYARNWSPKLNTQLQYSASTYVGNGDNRQLELFTEASQSNEIKEKQIKFDIKYSLNKFLSLQGGYQYTQTKNNNNQVLETSSIPITTVNSLTTNAYFVNGTLSLFDAKTQINLGGRYTYLKNLEIQLEPRLHVAHSVNANWNTFLSAEKKHQSVLQFTARENQLLELENKQWLLANNEDNPLLKSKQYALGSDYSIKDWTLSAEIFYKEVDGINSENIDFRNQFQNSKAIGGYTVKGFEASLGKKTKHITTWLSYTYLDNNYIFNTLSPNEFRSNFDIKHSLSIATTYQYKNFKIAAGANYHSGIPYTTPLSNEVFLDSEGTPQIHYNTPNDDTLDPYFRATISGLYNFKLSDTFKGRLNLSLLNIFNTKNSLDAYFQVETDQNGNHTINRVDQYSLGFTPNISFQLLF